MDNKDGKKKESIDDILSDLNGLLNKMPSILDGIKMPDIKPVDFKEPPAPVPAPAAAPVPEPEPVHEPAPEPEEKKAVPPAFDAERTVIIDSLSSLPEGAELPAMEPAPAAAPAPLPEPADLSGSTLEEPAPLSAAGSDAAPDLAAAGLSVPAADEPEPVPAEVPAEAPARSEAAVPAEPPAEAAISALPAAGLVAGGDTMSDLAIPDIDALMQFTNSPAQEPAAAAEAGPQASLAPVAEPGSPVPPAADEPSEDDLAEFERQLSAAVPQEEAKPAAAERPAEIVPAPEAEPFPVIEPAAGLSPAIELPAEPAPAVEPQAEPSLAETVSTDIPMDPAIERSVMAQPEYQEAPQEPVTEPAAEISLGAAAETVELAAPAGPAPEQELQVQLPETPAAEAQAPEMTVEVRPQGIQLEPAVNFGSASGEDTLQAAGGIKDIPRDPGLSVGFQPTDQGDATLVVAPQRSSGGDEDKTVVFQPSVGPGVTNRAGLADLDNLSRLPVPEGVPEERVRSLMFIYSAEAGALCANLLAELDAICQRSQTAPMFIKRAAVKPFEADLNANFVMQTVSDSGAAGLICVGDVPQEKLYEMENIFGSSGAYFRHYDRDSFNHTAMLDMLLEVILR